MTKRLLTVLVLFFGLHSAAPICAQTVRYDGVPPGAHPHDVGPAPDGSVWYTE